MWVLIISLLACDESECRLRTLAVKEYRSSKACMTEGKVMKEIYAPLYTKVTFRCEKD